MRIRAASAEDAAAIASLYAPYVLDTAASFESEPPDESMMRGRMMEGAGLYPWLVAEEEGGTLAGYAYACAFRSRFAYRFAVETTVYLRRDSLGRGLGSALYRPLLAGLEAQGFTQAIAAITLPNDASVCLHEKMGFEAAGTYRRVGWKMDAWRDVGLWQRPLAPEETPPREPRLPKL